MLAILERKEKYKAIWHLAWSLEIVGLNLLFHFNIQHGKGEGLNPKSKHDK